MLKTVLIIIAAVIAIVVLYLLYVLAAYRRIPDRTVLTLLDRSDRETVLQEVPLSIITYNVGFAAYTKDFSFFMDDGKYSRAFSKEAVLQNMKDMQNMLSEHVSDFTFLQEVDFGSTRTYHVDEAKLFRESDPFEKQNSVFAVNYDSPYLFWPILSPHGKSRSGLLTFSRYRISSALRRSLPVQDSVARLLDLDRCYSVTRLPAGNRELLLYHFHLSAYGTDPTLGERQLDMLFEDMRSERAKGNYCLAGGDFNKDLLGYSGDYFPSNGEKHSGVTSFPVEKLPDGFTLLYPFDEATPVPTCRNAHEPYEKGHTYVQTIDGFIVTDNITAEKPKVIDTEFLYSDHNPVTMKFTLNK